MRAGHLLIILLVAVTIIYALFRAETLIAGPSVTVFSPIAHEELPQFFTLDGNVQDAVYLAINDQRIYPDSEGFFEKDLVLPPGYTIVEVYARSRHGQEEIIHLPLHIYAYDTNEKDRDEENEITKDNKENNSQGKS